MSVATLNRAAARDIAAAMTAEEARFLVDFYYAVQDYRIQATGQARSVAQEADAGVSILADWLGEQMSLQEKAIQRGLEDYSDAHVPGRWAKSITGIGPVLAAGLLAHIDIEQAPTVGHIWRFAGLDPTMKWEAKTKRPWNAKLKVLCWKIGDSFVKNKGRESDVYGKVYAERKQLELERDAAGLFSAQAETALAERKIRDADLRKTYESGHLPAGRLDLRARRYAVKLFLSHYQHVAYEDHYGEAPPKPYILTRPDHAHFVRPPNWPL